MDYKIGKEEDIVESRRSSERVSCDKCLTCIRYFREGKEILTDKPIELVLLNISEKGLGIKTEHCFEVGSNLIFDLNLEEIIYKNISAKVIWQQRRGMECLMGLTFLNISGKLNKHLHTMNNRLNVHA